MPWFVYIVQCSDDTLYTGITNDVSARMKDHNNGKGAKYTKSRTPVGLVYCQPRKNRSEAAKREYEIKCMSRRQKQNLIKDY